MSTVYLLHFEEPYVSVREKYTDKEGNVKRGKRRARCQHYIGWCRDLDARIADHLSGRGSRLLAAVASRGIRVVVARTWEGGPKLEQELKRARNHKRHCPICRGEKAMPKANPEWSRKLAEIIADPTFVETFPDPTERYRITDELGSYETVNDLPQKLYQIVEPWL